MSVKSLLFALLCSCITAFFVGRMYSVRPLECTKSPVVQEIPMKPSSYIM